MDQFCLFAKNTRIFGMFVQRSALGELFATTAHIVFLAGMDRHVLAQVPLVLEPFATQLAHKPIRLIHAAATAATTITIAPKGGTENVLEKSSHEIYKPQ